MNNTDLTVAKLLEAQELIRQELYKVTISGDGRMPNQFLLEAQLNITGAVEALQDYEETLLHKRQQ